MSYRVIKQTQITNEKLAIEALKIAGMSYTKQGNTLHITSGTLNRATIDLSTGDITGDSDFRGHSADAFGVLRQHYGEAQCRETVLKQGITINDRQIERIDGEDCVVLYCRQG